MLSRLPVFSGKAAVSAFKSIFNKSLKNTDELAPSIPKGSYWNWAGWGG